MGYTHYFYRPPVLPSEKFIPLVRDVMQLRDVVEKAGIPIAGWNGEGEPEFNEETIAFNGKEDCGHARRNLGITWPAPGASGVAVSSPGSELAVGGSWFAGAQLTQRSCGGDCSHETLRIDRVLKKEDIEWQDDRKYASPRDKGMYFSCCKTAYKPYDLFVTAVLIAAKHHLGDMFRVSSDGDEPDWNDGRQLCMSVLEYGSDFRLRD